MSKKLLVISVYLFVFLATVHPAFADSADVTKIQNFIQSIIDMLVAIAGLIAVIFFVIGGFGYMTSSGNPEHLERSKRTVLYSGVGLAITLGAFVLSKIVTDLAQTAFGK